MDNNRLGLGPFSLAVIVVTEGVLSVEVAVLVESFLEKLSRKDG
jgi:hypothetical protein